MDGWLAVGWLAKFKYQNQSVATLICEKKLNSHKNVHHGSRQSAKSRDTRFQPPLPEARTRLQ